MSDEMIRRVIDSVPYDRLSDDDFEKFVTDLTPKEYVYAMMHCKKFKEREHRLAVNNLIIAAETMCEAARKENKKDIMIAFDAMFAGVCAVTTFACDKRKGDETINKIRELQQMIMRWAGNLNMEIAIMQDVHELMSQKEQP